MGHLAKDSGILRRSSLLPTQAGFCEILAAGSGPLSWPRIEPYGSSMKKSAPPGAQPPSELIDARIEHLADWRGEMLTRLRALIKQADPEVIEEWKWAVPVWSHDGLFLHRRNLQECREEDFRQGRLPAGSGRPVQFKSRRQHPARDRLSRSRQARSEVSEGAHSGCCGVEQVFFIPRLARPKDGRFAMASQRSS
jgi:hypothetical protein